MMAALHEDLGAAERDRFLNLLIDFIERDHIRVVILFRAIKRAELAIDVADVGVVDVAIDDICYDLVAAAVVSIGSGELASAVGQSAEFFEWQSRKAERLLLVDARTIPDFLEQIVG